MSNFTVTVNGIVGGVPVKEETYNKALSKAFKILQSTGKIEQGHYLFKDVTNPSLANVSVTGAKTTKFYEAVRVQKQATKQTYIVPVGWQVYSTIRVEAGSPEEAVALAQRVQDEIPLTQGEYVDGSYFIDTEGMIGVEGTPMAVQSLSTVTVHADGNVTR